MDAELRVGFGGLEERYISRVIGKPFESVTVSFAPLISLIPGDCIGTNALVQLSRHDLVVLSSVVSITACQQLSSESTIPITTTQRDSLTID